MKGRKIFGGLVPYGEVWRAGANEATTLVTDTNLNIGGKDVPAGSYTIFTLPNADKWVLIISKKTGEWGVPYPGEGDDLARVDMRVSPLSSPMENFTIGFDQTGLDLRHAPGLGEDARLGRHQPEKVDAEAGVACGDQRGFPDSASTACWASGSSGESFRAAW